MLRNCEWRRRSDGGCARTTMGTGVGSPEQRSARQMGNRAPIVMVFDLRRGGGMVVNYVYRRIVDLARGTAVGLRDADHRQFVG